MRKMISTMLAGLLAACSPEPTTSAANAATASAAEDARPVAPAAAAATSDSQRGLAERREDALRGCIGGGRDAAGPNVPVEAHCTCTIDRLMAGRTIAELDAEEGTDEYAARFRTTLMQCRREIGDGG